MATNLHSERPEDSQSGSPPKVNRWHPIDWAINSGATADVLFRLDRRLRHRRRRQWVAAGGVAAVVLAVVAWRVTGNPVAPSSILAAPMLVVSEPVRRALPDGSTLELRDGAVVRVEFTPRVRRVVLEQGAAHFNVRKDAARMFIVQAGQVDVCAIGTAFSVQLTPASTEVIVTEGRVALQTALTTGGASAFGGRASYRPRRLHCSLRAIWPSFRSSTWRPRPCPR